MSARNEATTVPDTTVLRPRPRTRGTGEKMSPSTMSTTNKMMNTTSSVPKTFQPRPRHPQAVLVLRPAHEDRMGCRVRRPRPQRRSGRRMRPDRRRLLAAGDQREARAAWQEALSISQTLEDYDSAELTTRLGIPPPVTA